MTIREKELAGLAPGSDPPRRLPLLLERLVEPFRRGAAPEPRPATGFYTDTTVCIGCKACEVACKQWNQLPADGFDWTGNSYDNTGELSATSWRHVKFIEQLPDKGVPVLPGPDSDGLRSRPLAHDERRLQALRGGAVPAGLPHRRHHPQRVRQRLHPAGHLQRLRLLHRRLPLRGHHPRTIDGHAHKCTLCFDRQRDGLVPACAKACPTESIQFGPIDELRERARKRVEELHERGVTDAYLYGDVPGPTYSALNSFYLLVDRPSVYGLPETPVNPWLAMKGDYLRAILSGLLSHRGPPGCAVPRGALT